MSLAGSAARLVDLRPGEAPAFRLLAALFFVTGLGNVFGGTAAESVFLKIAGVGLLPTFFVASEIGIASASLALAWLSARVRPTLSLLLLLVSGAAVTAALAPALGLELRWVAFALYLLFQVVSIGTYIQLGCTLPGYLDLGQLKRQLPVLYAVAAAGRIAGGLAIPALVRAAGNTGLLVLWAVCLVSTAGVVRAFDERIKPLPRPGGADRTEGGPLLRLMRRYTLMPLFLTFVGVATLLFRVADFHSGRLLVSIYTTQEGLSAFYGKFSAASSVAAVAIGTLLAPWMLARLGVGRTLAGLPAFSLAIGLALALSPGLAAAMLARFNTAVVRATLLQPALDVLRNALPARLGRATITIASSAVIPGATALVWLLLRALGPDASDRTLGAVSLAAAAGLCGLSVPMARAYGRALILILESRQLARARSAVAAGPALDGAPAAQAEARVALPPATLEALLARVRSADPEESELAAMILARAREPRLASPLREALVQCRDGRAAAHLASAPGVLADPVVAELVVRQMEAHAGAGGSSGEGAPLVEVVAHLGRLGDSRFAALLARLASASDPWVRAEALVGLARTGEGDPDGVRRLDDDVAPWEEARASERAPPARDPERARAAIHALARLGVPGAIDRIAPLVRAPELSRAALAALVRLDTAPTEDRLATYEQALACPDGTVRDAAITLLARADPARAAATFVGLLAHPRGSVVAAAAGHLSRAWREALPLLEELLAHPGAPVAARREALALLALWHQGERVTVHARTTVAGAYRALDRLVRLSSRGLPASPARELLEAVLAQRAREALTTAAGALLALHDPGERATVLAGLASTDRALRARALEALAGVLPGDLAAPLVRPFESWDPPELVAHGLKLRILDDAGPPAEVLGELASGPDPYTAAAAAYLMGARPTAASAAAVAAGLDPVARDAVGSGTAAATPSAARGSDSMTTLEKLMFLRSVDLFRQFAVEDLKLIGEIGREVELAAEQVLFRAGDAADRVWVLVRGNVSLYVEKDGSFHLITLLGERDCFGEVAVFDGGAHPASARVEQDGLALVIDREDMLSLIREYPSLALAFLAELAQSLRRLQGRIQLLENAMQAQSAPAPP
jgi:hypothetical protein